MLLYRTCHAHIQPAQNVRRGGPQPTDRPRPRPRHYDIAVVNLLGAFKEGLAGAVNLGLPGEEDEDVARGAVEVHVHGDLDAALHVRGRRQLALGDHVAVRHGDGEHAAGDNVDAAAEKGGKLHGRRRPAVSTAAIAHRG